MKEIMSSLQSTSLFTRNKRCGQDRESEILICLNLRSLSNTLTKQTRLNKRLLNEKKTGTGTHLVCQ